jgi:hypothetical protein
VEILKSILILEILGAFMYAGVIVAMIYGWGLWPKSWFWVIAGYAMANSGYPLLVGLRAGLDRLLKKYASPGTGK